jgi:sulfur-carrier protein adenylyltransferase/sulfurtransferase
VVDFDTVDFSNLQRQIIHGTPDVGRSKAESAKDTIQRINPNVEVVLHNTRITSDNAWISWRNTTSWWTAPIISPRAT